MTTKELTKEIAQFFNVYSTRVHYEFANELTKQHRFLVEEIFQAIMLFIIKLSQNYKENKYDDRNEYACKTADIVIEALKEEPKFLRSILSEANKASQAIIKKVEFAGGKELENETEVKKEVKTQKIEIEEEEFVLTPEC